MRVRFSFSLARAFSGAGFRRAMRACGPALGLTGMLLVVGCTTSSVVSEKPLSSPQAAVADPRLAGLWRGFITNTSYVEYLYIDYQPKKGSGSMMSFGLDSSGGVATIQCDFFVTRTARHTYLNLSHYVYRAGGRAYPDYAGKYKFAEYRFTWLGQLDYGMAMGDAFCTAIERGKLRGKVSADKSNALLKDSSERILAFIESCKEKDIFDPPTKFSRIRSPALVDVSLLDR